MEHQYFKIYKPYKMVSQFVSSHDVNLLGEIDYTFPIGTHAIGRLDNYSEGLLLLTTDKKITKLLFQGSKPHTRTYVVQVNGKIQSESLIKLSEGVAFKIKKGDTYTSIPCEVSLTPSIDDTRAEHEKIYHTSSWIKIKITEGKYHQIRKMVRAVGHKCLRLIRTEIEDISLNEMKPGEVIKLRADDFYRLLNLHN